MWNINQIVYIRVRHFSYFCWCFFFSHHSAIQCQEIWFTFHFYRRRKQESCVFTCHWPYVFFFLFSSHLANISFHLNLFQRGDKFLFHPEGKVYIWVNVHCFTTFVHSGHVVAWSNFYFMFYCTMHFLFLFFSLFSERNKTPICLLCSFVWEKTKYSSPCEVSCYLKPNSPSSGSHILDHGFLTVHSSFFLFFLTGSSTQRYNLL